jgi:hypothetical protein
MVAPVARAEPSHVEEPPALLLLDLMMKVSDKKVYLLPVHSFKEIFPREFSFHTMG